MSLFSKGVKSCHFSLIDTESTSSPGPAAASLFGPLQVFTAWVRTHAREKLWQSSRNMTSSWPLKKGSSIFDKASQKWTKISPKPEKNLSMFWGVQFSKNQRAFVWCHVFLESCAKTRKMVNLIDVVFLFFKKKTWVKVALATMPAFSGSLYWCKCNLLVWELKAFLPMFVSSFKYPQIFNMTIGGLLNKLIFPTQVVPNKSVFQSSFGTSKSFIS